MHRGTPISPGTGLPAPLNAVCRSRRRRPWIAVFLILAATGAEAQSSHATAPPAPELPNPLTAEALAQAVVQRNPNLQALQAAVVQAKARVEPAGSLDDPMLGYLVAPQTIGSPLGTRHIVQFSQAIPWPGTLGSRERAALNEATAAASDVQAYRLEVTAASKSLLAEWYFLGQALAINDRNQSLLSELIETARTRYAAGRARQQDVLQAEVERGLLGRTRFELERQSRVIQAQINALLNRLPDEPLPPAIVPPAAESPELQRVREAALKRHPELARLRSLLAANESRVDLAEKAYYPDFRLLGNFVGPMDPEEKRWQVGIGINIPLDRSKRRAGVNGARAAAQRVQWQLQDREVQLLSQLEMAGAALEETRETGTLYEEQLLPLAQASLAAARSDYRAGGGVFLNVITAEQRLLHTELALERTRADHLRALAQLERWAGGTLAPPTP